MFRRWISAALIAAVSLQAFAADDAEKTVRDAFRKVSPSANPTSVTKSELPGFYQVLVDGSVYYISSDGKYLVRGNVFDIDARTDIGEKQLAALRKGTLAKIPANKELVFAPENPKYTVTVFTDVDCPYCRQFHKQIADFNKLGIAVRYVLFPLPMHKGADKKAETVWCSDDRNATYTSAMAGKWDKPPTAAPKTPAADNAKTEETLAYTPLTCSNPIDELTTLGREMGVDGTPAIFTADGDHVGGYMAPEQLLQRLDQLAQRGGPVAAK
jgi:thiol:disulfide interchange protein DsbC